MLPVGGLLFCYIWSTYAHYCRATHTTTSLIPVTILHVAFVVPFTTVTIHYTVTVAVSLRYTTPVTATFCPHTAATTTTLRTTYYTTLPLPPILTTVHVGPHTLRRTLRCVAFLRYGYVSVRYGYATRWLLRLRCSFLVVPVYDLRWLRYVTRSICCLRVRLPSLRFDSVPTPHPRCDSFDSIRSLVELLHVVCSTTFPTTLPVRSRSITRYTPRVLRLRSFTVHTLITTFWTLRSHPRSHVACHTLRLRGYTRFHTTLLRCLLIYQHTPFVLFAVVVRRSRTIAATLILRLRSHLRFPYLRCSYLTDLRCSLYDLRLPLYTTFTGYYTVTLRYIYTHTPSHLFVGVRSFGC